MTKIREHGSMPIPEKISPELHEFLVACFVKNPAQRIDAQGLLNHAWMAKEMAPPQGLEIMERL